MALTAAVLALILGAQAKTKVIEEHFDQLPRGGAPKGWVPVNLDRGPLGIWGAGRVRQPGSWPQALLQDGRPHPPRWVGLGLPGVYESCSARVLVGGGKAGSGAAGLAVIDGSGLTTLFVSLAGGVGLSVAEPDGTGKWSSQNILADRPVLGPCLLFVSVDKDGKVKASWGTVEKISLREEKSLAGSPPWTLALAARTEGTWWFDDLKINGKLQLDNSK